MRILVTGTEGQLVRSIVERAAAADDIDVFTLGRPELDLARPESVANALANTRFDLIVSAAAYTAVDQAENEPLIAHTVNGAAAGAIARVAAERDVPIIHISTDYVFNGRKTGSWREDDPTDPISVYGASKLAGEKAVLEAASKAVVLRTAWVYSPFGKNFAKTMLRLADGRDQISVVADQTGTPTNALDIADGVIAIARNLADRPKDPSLYGVFHMTASASHVAPTWADFAEQIFLASHKAGGPSAGVARIATAQYPTPAARPQNSWLNCDKLEAAHAVRLPEWTTPIEAVVRRMLTDG